MMAGIRSFSLVSGRAGSSVRVSAIRGRLHATVPKLIHFCSGLWMLYDQQKNLCPSFSNDSSSAAPSASTWLSLTQTWTNSLLSNVNLTTTHDIGFLSEPFQSASTLRSNASFYTPILSQMASNLAARYVPTPGVIRCWNDPGSHNDSVLVIIDSVMNLPLLVRSAQNYTGNNTLIDPIVMTHIDRLQRNNMRKDGSTFHVCDYSATSGDLYLCRTQQGLSDNSTWARGQAWAIHDFTELYDLLGNQTYLDTARRAADWFIDHLPRTAEDGTLEVPYWDFDAPYEPATTPRDVSAGMIAASGLLSLAQHNPISQDTSPPTLNKYSIAAIQLLNSAASLALATPISFSEASTPAQGVQTNLTTSPTNTDTRQFESVFMHSTVNGHPGTVPGSGGNYDTGLIYADTYAIEAINKLLRLGYVSCNGTMLAKADPDAGGSNVRASTAHRSFQDIGTMTLLSATVALLTTLS
jgi:hypothetical protein